MVTISPQVAGAESVDLYFEGGPATTDFSLDNVSLREYIKDESWKDRANQRIENIRQGSKWSSKFYVISRCS